MKRVLEVCDDDANREMIAYTCRQMGFEVVEATCGDEAIALFRDNGPFALVLTDLYYFDGVTEPPLTKLDCVRDGIQLANAIRTIKPDQRIVIHTSSRAQLAGLCEVPVLRKGGSDFLSELREVLNTAT
jgi:CheY-like chemotaxis protein